MSILNKTSIKCAVAVVACLTAAISNTALASVTQNIEPTTIGVGEAARLTIAASVTEGDSITPPMVSGL